VRELIVPYNYGKHRPGGETKDSEGVKWGIRQKNGSGCVYGYSAMPGYRTEKGKLKIVPEKRKDGQAIIYSYVYVHKGGHIIVNELNAAGLLSVKGNAERRRGIADSMKYDKKRKAA